MLISACLGDATLAGTYTLLQSIISKLYAILHVCLQDWDLLIQLHKAEALAAGGDLQQACSICREALDLSTAAGLNMQRQAPAAQVYTMLRHETTVA